MNKNKQEQGQILIILALAIFAFSSIVTVPLLNFTTTGVVAARNQGVNAQEIYAAEAGVHDAIWKIMYVVPGIPKKASDLALKYAIDGGVNGASVNVTISHNETGTYHIQSLATNNDTGHQRTIDSDINIGSSGADLSAFTKNAMTCTGNITTKKSDAINGDIWVGGNYDNNATGNHTVTSSPVTGWPTAEELEAYFGQQVDKTSPYSNGTINVANPGQSGPLYAQGCSTYTLTGTGQLTGTIYVVGNLNIDNAANVTLNGKTIFVTGDITINGADIYGPGGIIAIGNINFQPHLNPSYLFVMSVSGTVNLQPNSNFVGAIAGNTQINLQPGCTLTWIDPGVANLEMPGLFNNISAIQTWNIH